MSKATRLPLSFNLNGRHDWPHRWDLVCPKSEHISIHVYNIYNMMPVIQGCLLVKKLMILLTSLCVARPAKRAQISCQLWPESGILGFDVHASIAVLKDTTWAHSVWTVRLECGSMGPQPIAESVPPQWLEPPKFWIILGCSGAQPACHQFSSYKLS